MSVTSVPVTSALTETTPLNLAAATMPSLVEQMTKWRRHIHSLPECGFDVVHTAEFIANKLESFGIEVVRNIGQSGVVGILRSGDGKASIGLRADMDRSLIHISDPT